MLIRTIEPQDFEAVGNMYEQLVQFHKAAGLDLTVNKSAEEYYQMLREPDCHSVVAEENGKLIGMCITKKAIESFAGNHNVCYIRDLYVVPEFRHQGVARSLYQETEQWAKSQKMERIDLQVWGFNQNAIHFYKKQGMAVRTMVMEKYINE